MNTTVNIRMNTEWLQKLNATMSTEMNTQMIRKMDTTINAKDEYKVNATDSNTWIHKCIRNEYTNDYGNEYID